MNFKTLYQISRKHFWVYTVGPFLIWVAASWILRDIRAVWVFTQRSLPIVLLLVRYIGYFIFPANLLIYWINDIADWDTDAYNDKKWTYEHKLKPKQTKKLHKKILYRNLLPHIWWVMLLAILSMQWWTISPWIIVAFIVCIGAIYIGLSILYHRSSIVLGVQALELNFHRNAKRKESKQNFSNANDLCRVLRNLSIRHRIWLSLLLPLPIERIPF